MNENKMNKLLYSNIEKSIDKIILETYDTTIYPVDGIMINSTMYYIYNSAIKDFKIIAQQIKNIIHHEIVNELCEYIAEYCKKHKL